MTNHKIQNKCVMESSGYFRILDNIKNNILMYLTKPDDDNLIKINLIKNHNKELYMNGDISFPLNAFIWHKNGYKCQGFCDTNITNSGYSDDDNDNYNNIFNCKLKRKCNLKDEIKSLIDHSKTWCIPLENVKIINEKCSLFLDKCSAFTLIISQIFEDSAFDNCVTYENFINENTSSITSTTDSFIDLTGFRKFLIKSVTKNLIHLKYKLLSKNNNKNSDYKNILNYVENTDIKCGLVLDSKTGKQTSLTLDEYFSLRSNDMRLIAMHKYGIRNRAVSTAEREDNNNYFKGLISLLGSAAVIIDLLEVKSTSPAKCVRNGQGSTKGAAFILYNSARLETILKKFNEKILNGNYPPLPSLDNCDFSLLKENEEWQLFFNYVIQFPSIIENCLKIIIKTEEINNDTHCDIHRFIQFIQGLVSEFSVYYRRIRILTEHRHHMMPTIHARIYLLKSLQKILNECLLILGLTPITYM